MSDGLTLRGGWVVDGTGGPRRRADVAIRGGVITFVGPHAPSDGGRVLDVDGLVVAPGFIDMHAHSDLAVLRDPQHRAKSLQGVTTEVCGQDGLSYVPASAATQELMVTQLAGWNGVPSEPLGLRTVGDYLDRVDRGAAVNVAYLVPQGTVRAEVMGMEDRVPTEDERARMEALVAEGMRDGAVGLSTGLTYVPGMFAGDDELESLIRVVARMGGYHCTHHRNYGATALEAYGAAIRLAQRSGAPLHLAHCHLNFPPNRGRAPELLALIDAATAAGQDVTLDSYPYTAGATYLHALLPSWVQRGGIDATLTRLSDDGIRAQVIDELDHTGSDGHHGMPVDWSTIVVTSVGAPALREACGRSIDALAVAAGRRAADHYLDLLAADRFRSGCRVEVGDEQNVRAIMRHRAHTVGTDGILIGDAPHPRGFGSFPRILGRYVRELGVLGLEDAIAHMTGRPARRLGLSDRGRIEPGACADVVVLDPRTVGSLADERDPRRSPDGIVHVLVNGVPTVLDAVRTEWTPGRSIRGPAYHSAKDPSSWNHNGGRQR